MKAINHKSDNQLTRQTKPVRLILGMIAGLLVSSASLADDISVYGDHPKNPKILFVLDYSLSMEKEVGNSGEQRIDVLRDTVLDLMDQYKDQVEFGVGPLFAGTGGGVQWPISDLTLDANVTDPSIPDGTATGFEVVESLIKNTELKWGTATVPALAESIQYFRGGPVNFGGVDTPHTFGFKPLEWDTTTNSFAEFNGFSGNSTAFKPEDANAYSVGTAPGSKGYCRKLTDPNKGRRTATNDCSYLPANYVVGNCIAASAARVQFPYYVNRDPNHDFEVCEYEHNDQWAGASYESPITNECQPNSIILVSDGEPANSIPEYMVKDIIGDDFASCQHLGQSVFGKNNVVAGNCAIEITREVATNPQITSNPNSTITTNTVGFGIGSKGANFLTEIADAGPGEYLSANNADDLFQAIKSLIENELPDSQQFSNFSVNVDRASLSHDNRAYVPLFQPSDKGSWNGNIKGYFLGNDGLEDVNGVPAIEVVDSVSRYIDSSRSFWSDTNDGNSVVEGGVSGELDPTTRKLYTYLGDNIPNAGVALAGNGNERHELKQSNTQLTPDLFGGANQANPTILLNWIRQQSMGEPLHSNTVIANYKNDERVVFAMTNQGFLHAFNASTPVVPGDYTGGEELFAFMPKDLLSNISLMRNGQRGIEHIYGLDGNITPIHTDKNRDGIVNENDKLVLVFGMRRGGANYYAMDVTDSKAPKLLWQIKGGVDAGFEKLAQTWSEPQLISVKKGNKAENVLVFGGGYDDSVDDIHAATPSNGNSIFMVDMKGELIWSASDPDMIYGIPSSVRVIDSNADSFADRIYVGDLGGQVWRVDFDDITDASSFEVNRFAELGNNDHQPFFYPPSISRDSVEDRLLVSIGSGNRDNPVRDRSRSGIFTMYDDSPDMGAPEAGSQEVRLNDLVDATNIEFAASDDLDGSKGWVIRLEPGEKSLSAVVGVNGDLLATTYTPTVAENYNGCNIPTADRRLYAVNVKNAGAPNGVTNNEFESTPVNRFINLDSGGIPPSPYSLIQKGSDTVDVYVGNEKQLELSPTLERVFWYNE